MKIQIMVIVALLFPKLGACFDDEVSLVQMQMSLTSGSEMPEEVQLMEKYGWTQEDTRWIMDEMEQMELEELQKTSNLQASLLEKWGGQELQKDSQAMMSTKVQDIHAFQSDELTSRLAKQDQLHVVRSRVQQQGVMLEDALAKTLDTSSKPLMKMSPYLAAITADANVDMLESDEDAKDSKLFAKLQRKAFKMQAKEEMEARTQQIKAKHAAYRQNIRSMLSWSGDASGGGSSQYDDASGDDTKRKEASEEASVKQVTKQATHIESKAEKVEKQVKAAEKVVKTVEKEEKKEGKEEEKVEKKEKKKDKKEDKKEKKEEKKLDKEIDKEQKKLDK